MRLADAVVVLTPDYRDTLRSRLGEAWREDKVHVIPNRIDTDAFAPGTRVRVTQQLPQTHTVWTTTVEGTVCRYRQAKTGSWFAHAKADKLWLDRLELKKDDGELVTLNLDRYSVIEGA